MTSQKGYNGISYVFTFMYVILFNCNKICLIAHNQGPQIILYEDDHFLVYSLGNRIPHYKKNFYAHVYYCIASNYYCS